MNIASIKHLAKVAALKEQARSVGVPVDERAEIRRLAAENRVLRRISSEHWRKGRAGVDGGGAGG